MKRTQIRARISTDVNLIALLKKHAKQEKRGLTLDEFEEIRFYENQIRRYSTYLRVGIF